MLKVIADLRRPEGNLSPPTELMLKQLFLQPALPGTPRSSWDESAELCWRWQTVTRTRTSLLLTQRCTSDLRRSQMNRTPWLWKKRAAEVDLRGSVEFIWLKSCECWRELIFHGLENVSDASSDRFWFYRPDLEVAMEDKALEKADANTVDWWAESRQRCGNPPQKCLSFLMSSHLLSSSLQDHRQKIHCFPFRPFSKATGGGLHVSQFLLDKTLECERCCLCPFSFR